MTLEELLNEQGIYFIPKGKDYLVKCLNPEHDDSNPSMRIDKLTGTFGCFSCGYKGNIFSEYNIIRDHQTEQVANIRKKLQDILVSTKGHEMPEGFVFFNRDFKGIAKSTLRAFEAFTHDEDFPDRIVFPIKDLSGRIVAFNARRLYSDLDPKYIVAPAEANVPLCPAKVNPINKSIILVEGLFDMINLHEKGLTNAVCCFGTSKLSRRTVKAKLEPYWLQGATTIFVAFDNDSAGRKAATELVKVIRKHTDFICEDVVLPEGKDPGELTEEEVSNLNNALYKKGT